MCSYLLKHSETHPQNTLLGMSRRLSELQPYTEPEGTDIVIAPYSSKIDDRTTHEFYMWTFGNAVRAGVASVMCSYNRVNGS